MAHKTVTVQPADDGHNMQSNWEVKTPAKTTSHTSKQAAKNEADRRAHVGDTKIYKGTNGQIIDRRTHRGGRDDDDSDNGSKHGVDIPLGPTDYGQDTMDSAFPW